MHHGYRPGSLSSLRAVGVCPMSLNCSFKLTALEPRFSGLFSPTKISPSMAMHQGTPGWATRDLR